VIGDVYHMISESGRICLFSSRPSLLIHGELYLLLESSGRSGLPFGLSQNPGAVSIEPSLIG